MKKSKIHFFIIVLIVIIFIFFHYRVKTYKLQKEIVFTDLIFEIQHEILDYEEKDMRYGLSKIDEEKLENLRIDLHHIEGLKSGKVKNKKLLKKIYSKYEN